MIRRNIDIVAVLVLLAAFGLFQGVRGIAVHIAQARLEICAPPRPVVVRLPAFRLNRLPRLSHVPGVPRAPLRVREI